MKILNSKTILCTLCTALSYSINNTTSFAQEQFSVDSHKTIISNRDDNRFISTYAIAHSLLKDTKPKYAFSTSFNKKQFKHWQKGLRNAMLELMKHPKVSKDCCFKRIENTQREGYVEEKWEFYPLENCVSTFYVLIPNDKTDKTPAVMCIPGSGMTKEHLIGRVSANNMRAAMALNIVKQGYIAVAVDNAASGDASDLENITHRGYDYDTSSRLLLELGWSYLGYTSFINKVVLDWMKTNEAIRKDRIVVSGFSLGTEPLMVLGALDPEIYAFVYNDFLCQTQERAIVMTAPDENGRRPFPNSIRHLIPNFWNNFNFPDIVASLAPRPIILTEGGLDRDLDMVREAYKISGHPENVEIHHYQKYNDPSTRNHNKTLPEGLNRDEYYKSVNVDGSMHYFKNEFVMPWLHKVLDK